MWLNVYNTNNNPRVIAGYFLETVQKYGGTANMVRGDFGTENVLVRQMQRQFRRIDNTTAYIAGASTQNQRIESWWGYLRRQHIQYWMDIFNILKENVVFSGSELDKNLVQFCFMALIQVSVISSLFKHIRGAFVNIENTPYTRRTGGYSKQLVSISGNWFAKLSTIF